MRRSFAFIAAAVLAAGLVPSSAIAAPKKLLDYHADSAWRSIRDTRLSRDGRWVAYAEVPAEADGRLVVRDLTSAARYEAARGRGPVFTADAQFLVYRIEAPLAAVKAAAKDDTPPAKAPKPGLGIMRLADGSVTLVERVRSFKLAQNGLTLAALLEPAPAPSPLPSSAPSPSAKSAVAAVPSPAASPASGGPEKDATTSLAMRRLGTTDVQTVANVSEYALSADGSHVAYVVQTKGDESLHIRDVARAADTTLAHGTAHLTALALSTDGAKVAYLRDPDAYADPEPKKEAGARAPFRLMVADVATGNVADVYGDTTARTFATDAVPPEFSADGSRLAFAWASVPAPRPSSAPARVDLDFWYAREGKLPTQQRIEADDPKYGAYLALYDLGAKQTIRLETPDVPSVMLRKDAPYALGISNVPYVREVTWDTEYDDLYRIDVATGARTVLLRRARSHDPQLSPTGAYAIGYDGARRAWYTIRLRDARRTWITDPHMIHAAVEDDDHPDDPPPYGIGGWTPGDAAVLVYDRYDIWSVSPDGGPPRNLTAGVGRKTKHIYRVVHPRIDDPASLFPTERAALAHAPYLLSVVDDRTKASGFATLASLVPQPPQTTLMMDARIGTPLGARSDGRLVFTIERFDQFPDLWATGAVPQHPQRVSDANPQAGQYATGHARLIEYTNARGEQLRAILVTPEGFDPHRKYPMLVYVYEKMTDELHAYSQPASGTVVNLARYVNHGYVVLMPDIRYRIGHTVASAVDCVGSAVKRVVGMGFVDPARIGMAGHSFGGFEVNALVTHTNIFHAVESGASDSDLTSLYGGFWQSGDVQQSYYERSQGRIGATPWARPDLYVENSPIFFVDRVHAPYLRIQDDKDGFVPYGQGVEFFTALRRAGKEAYMFTFIGENHALAAQANKDYWTVHLDEFFDYELLGAPRPDWMNHDIPFEHRGERDVESLFTPAIFAP